MNAALRRAVPITQDNADMDDPKQHLAWALGAFPSPNPQMGMVPALPTVPGMQSELLWELGFRHDPTEQTKWLIPGDHPEVGSFNVPKRVDREEYERWRAVHTDTDASADQWRATAERLLAQLNPEMAQQIAAMTTEEQKAQALEAARENLPPALRRLADLKRKEATE
ncbi:DUF2744 domain-containing protein [Nocardia sp. NBC_00511]|uniref:phage gene 29 protein family protein n=1 Tax=Nocardia sp. NBC_00511 TaxID=2903591 RepID=UPI0030E3DE53